MLKINNNLKIKENFEAEIKNCMNEPSEYVKKQIPPSATVSCHGKTGRRRIRDKMADVPGIKAQTEKYKKVSSLDTAYLLRARVSRTHFTFGPKFCAVIFKL